MRYAELCAGYGGLGLAVEEAFPGAELAWYSEFDPAPSKIMAHHWPHAPNHGDMTAIEQLKACGNGVVPQQAAAALIDMLRSFD